MVEKAFLKRCTGFYYNETTREPITVDEIDPKTGDLVKVTKMVVTKRARKHIVPDARGCMDWLTNRAPDRWKKVKHVEISGEEGGPVKTQGLVAVPSGPLTIAEWEKQVKEAIANDKKADADNRSADDAMDTPGGSQVRAVQFPVDFPFFGGARGGGLFAGAHLVGEDQHGRQWNGLIVQRKYNGLKNCAGASIN